MTLSRNREVLKSLLGCVCFALFLPGCLPPAKSDGGDIGQIVSRMKARGVKSISRLPAQDIETLRTAFNEYFSRVPDFEMALSVEETDFDKDMQAAMDEVTQICKGKSLSWVLDFFGKPSRVMWDGPTRIDLEYRTSVTGFSGIGLKDGVVVRGGEGGCVSVTYGWLIEGKAEYLQRILTRAKSPEDLSDDEEATFRRVFTALWQGYPLPESVVGEERTLKEAALRFLELCKGRRLEYVMRMMGKPKFIEATKDRRLRITYSTRDGLTVILVFDIDGKLIEIQQEKPPGAPPDRLSPAENPTISQPASPAAAGP